MESVLIIDELTHLQSLNRTTNRSSTGIINVVQLMVTFTSLYVYETSQMNALCTYMATPILDS